MEMLSITTRGSPAEPVEGPTLEIDDFGKLGRASIKLAPFTIICGKNNSGKSYLAYVIWALYNLKNEIFRVRQSELRAPAWFSDILRKAESNNDQEFVRIDHRKVNADVNRWLYSRKDKFASRLLNQPNSSIGSLKIRLQRDLFIKRGGEVPQEIGGSKIELDSWTYAWSDDGPQPSRGWMLISKSDRKMSDANLYVSVLEHIILGHNRHGADYIPAARSGLLLSTPFISDFLFSTLGAGRSVKPSSFTAPMVSFLRNLVRPSGGSPGSTSKIADFLESSILQGHVTRQDDGSSPEFTYTPQGSKTRIPVHATSSMVTELTPIIGLLRSPGLHALILEEPEAHLHLAAQRQMARALVRLSNLGIPVIVTTHSDTFIQQINFLMLLSRNKKRAKVAKSLGYSKEEFLDTNRVVAYELIPDGRKSHATELQIGEFGISPSTISDVVLSLSHEILEVVER